MEPNIPFISEVPIIEIRGTIVVEHARSGNCSLERTMDVKTLARWVERAQQALKQHADGDFAIRID